MKLEVNINKKFAIPLFASILVLAAAITVFAFGTNNPSSFGHSINELQGPGSPSGPGSCDNTKYVWYNSATGAWGCSDVQGGGQTCTSMTAQGSLGGSRTVHAVNMPSQCINGECTITMSVSYASGPLITIYQQFTNNQWAATPGLGGTNGDNSGAEIISFNGNPPGQGGGGTYLCDDEETSFSGNSNCLRTGGNPSENQNTKWTISIPGAGGNINGYTATLNVCWQE